LFFGQAGHRDLPGNGIPRTISPDTTPAQRSGCQEAPNHVLFAVITGEALGPGPWKASTKILEALTEQLHAIPASFTSVWIPIQLALIAFAALTGWALAAYLRRHLYILPHIMGWPTVLRRAIRVAIVNLGIIICIVILILMRIGMQAVTLPGRSYLIGVAASLATAWVVIAIAASLIRNAFINRVVSVVAWSITALSIVGLLDEVIAGLDRGGIVIGGLRVTALLALKTAALLLVTLWGAVTLSNFGPTGTSRRRSRSCWESLPAPR
jgi:hypothetical protein